MEALAGLSRWYNVSTPPFFWAKAGAAVKASASRQPTAAKAR
jgi:hypothetical protein